MSRRTALTLAFRGLGALVVAVSVLAACAESDDPADAVDVAPGTTTVTSTELDGVAPDDSVTPTPTSVAPDDPGPAIEAGGLEWRRADLTAAGYDAMRIVRSEDGFFALGYKIDEGEITTWSSEDGRAWKEIATDKEALQPGEFIMEVVATPAGYLATGGVAEWGWGEGPVDRMWNSADGSSWARQDFELADVARPNPYLTGEGTIDGLVAGPAEILLMGRSVLDLDHQAILDEIAPGTDAGGEIMIGVGVAEPSGKPGVEYLIGDDWVGISFEDMGLPAWFLDELGSETVGVWHSPDGSSWTPCPEAAAWSSQERELSLVAGPNGFLIDGGDMLYLSPDAEVWTELSAETAFGLPTGIHQGRVTGWEGGWAAIVEAGMAPREGPVEGTDFFTEVKAIWTSPDGMVWSESVVPTSMLLSDRAASVERLGGGELGLFALVDAETEEPDLSSSEIWWTADAVTWDPLQIGKTFGPDRFIWDIAISNDRVVLLAADWSGWRDEEGEDLPAPLELWVGTAP